MTQTLQLREGLPEDMQILLLDYPREAWPDHPHFARSIQNWMGAHSMFRKLSNLTRTTTEAYLEKTCSPDQFSDRLGYYGDLLVRNLHGHHSWEDRSFFPELSRADRRFDAGLETLENDHALLGVTLDNLTRSANRAIKLIQLDEKQAREETAKVHQHTLDIEALLQRHLNDEEDLVVPIILHHKLRG
jgi:iron-sulfur cluster repair protein YtfE (RIC family)